MPFEDAWFFLKMGFPPLQMDYQDAKVLANSHKTKEMAEASQRKARAAALNEKMPNGEPLNPPQPMFPQDDDWSVDLVQ